MSNKFEHISVMPKEVVDFLNIKRSGTYIDATLGGGGHSKLIAGQLRSEAVIIGIDKDFQAIKAAKAELVEYSTKIKYVCDSFGNLDQILNKQGIDKVDGILADLGVSSYQLDSPDRGFSFRGNDAKLDMRMDPNQNLSAYEVINEYSENELRDIFYKLGEERFAKGVAYKIILRRGEKPIEKTGELVLAIKSAMPPAYRYSRKEHFATKVFRAIRMEVNQELAELEKLIPKAIERLNKGGRLVIISFHSLEDRIVKHQFRDLAKEDVVKILTKKPISPTDTEIKENPRSESAKLRAVERL